MFQSNIVPKNINSNLPKIRKITLLLIIIFSYISLVHNVTVFEMKLSILIKDEDAKEKKNLKANPYPILVNSHPFGEV